MLAYTLDGNNATITGLGTYNLSANNYVLTIPATVTDNEGQHTVVAIGDNAFVLYDENNKVIPRTDITSVEFDNPSSVNAIGNNAFLNCSSLASINLPNTLKSIGSSAFSQSGLTSIILPASLETILINAFQGCPLTEVIFNGAFSNGFNPHAFVYLIPPSGDTAFSVENSVFNTWAENYTYFDRDFNVNNNNNYTMAPSCYNKGTKILCLNKQLEEEYIPIENLRKGDLVKSYKHGYRRVDLIGKNLMKNNPHIFNYCMYKMEKTETNGLLEDLIVTGGHVILVDELGIYKEQNEKIFGSTPMIDDKYLLLCSLSKDFTKIENTELYTYYHFTLENNGSDDERFGVWANGILSETVSKRQFTGHSYTLL